MLGKYGFKKPEFEGTPPLVAVGLSGGVDSSVAAYILKWQGYNVVGLFMKNWEEKDASGVCTTEADFADVKRVAEHIGIPYYTVNFSERYADSVFAALKDGLARGVTPNPDVLCNREVKFGPFLEHALKIGAEFVATGHYCRLGTVQVTGDRSKVIGNDKLIASHNGKCIGVNSDNSNNLFGNTYHLSPITYHLLFGNTYHLSPITYHLLKGRDPDKDQSYFLCGLSQPGLGRAMFPVGGLLKTEVREIAREAGLPTAEKKDSTGICFIGERNFKNFMKTYLGAKPGDIKTLEGCTVGRHDGLMYYTLGQRKGLGIGGKKIAKNDKRKMKNEGDIERWFVVRKDLENNILYVNNGECPEMFTRELVADKFNFISGAAPAAKFKAAAKVRYRQPDQKCAAEVLPDGRVRVTFEKPQRAVTPGQWVVLYDGEVCLGGGEIL
jgi:tRNA-specific 2-thiouridylase